MVMASCSQVDLEPEAASDVPMVRVDDAGALHFQSAQAFFAAMEAISRMSPEEQVSWEERIGFTSLRRTLTLAERQLESAQTPVEQERLLEAYADVIDASEGTLRPRLSSPGYAGLVNRAGVFYVNGVIHKVTPDMLIISRDGRPETVEKYVASPRIREQLEAEPELVPEEGVRVARYAGEHGVTAQHHCGYERSGRYQSSDRRLDMYLRSLVYVSSDGINTYRRAGVELQMSGEKKLLGSWRSYNTTYSYRNVSFQVDVPIVTGSSGGSSLYYLETQLLGFADGGSGGESPSHSIYSILGHIIQNNALPASGFHKVYGQGSSRGTGGSWVTINCGFCSDGTCNSFETAGSCVSDCGYCGDGMCYGSETLSSCPGDCSYCGDGLCTEGVTACASDCGGYCGDGLCSNDESTSCSDCCPWGQICPED
ncbi:hypothetical protein [Pyxidicoccus xibeiensis]|uniref:hypothetical protein n=1 Tax=Pyxidicoccus xibeiensis TaxID=2906759 RepID=UPI0020A7202D|nr:hypothetical protein [Pyxidicoccus xibeiensis]MCP3142420.1 hypothetical protein [Pyxidicoccus xibeiensis]